jgi:SpoVK/Ycf46/Vps4 family AAA+-type ATPase
MPTQQRRPDPLADIELLLRSRYPLILLDTEEEDRAESLLVYLADRLDIPLFVWTRTRGLRRADLEEAVYGTAKPLSAIAHIESARFPAIYLFKGLGPDLSDTSLSRFMREAAAPFEKLDGAIVLVGAGLELTDDIRQIAATVALPPPTRSEYRGLLGRVLRDVRKKVDVEMEQTAEDTNRMLENLAGLTLLEAEKVLTKAIIEDGKLAPADVARVAEAKRQLIERDGLLEYYPMEESMAEIADMATLKGWLEKRKSILSDPDRAREYGLSFPKGLLLLGVPGCGKSLCAKAVATEWRLPLLRLDPAGLYHKYIGETEKNFRRATSTAERMAPVVLWIDEIEKALASGSGEEDAGVSARVQGSFLAWLQERKGDVFVVATANDISRLRPELLRKGRFDEIFFVDLPDGQTRGEIFRIHLAKRGHEPDDFDLAVLAAATDGFSGSEIEQVVVAALYTSFANGSPLTTELLADESSRTHPLSQTMAEKITALREWARGRTVSAQ